MNASNQYYFAKKIVQKIQSGGEQAFICGGAVRDSLLNAQIKDVDVATSLGPKQVMSLFPGAELVGESFGVVLVKCPLNTTVEVATFRNDGIYSDGRHPDSVVFTPYAIEDAQRRDFTCNALYYDPTTKKTIDYVGGVKDIENRLLRCVGDPEKRFSEDALRILRAVRFAFKLGFSIAPDTEKAIKKFAHTLKDISAERVQNELTLIFKGQNADMALERLYQYGILDVILPEVAAMFGCTQSPVHHPEGDAFRHTALCVKFSRREKINLWATLLHDIGKPLTKDEDGHFLHHELASVDLAEPILTRLRFSNDEKEMILGAIKDHMKFLCVRDMKKSTLRRFMSTPHFDVACDLHQADSAASSKEFDAIEFLSSKRWEIEQAGEEVLPKPVVNGDQIMERFSLKPGRQIGELLRKIQDLQLEGTISTAEEAFSAIEVVLTQGE